jgi:hypothetical protein
VGKIAGLGDLVARKRPGSPDVPKESNIWEEHFGDVVLKVDGVRQARASELPGHSCATRGSFN